MRVAVIGGGISGLAAALRVEAIAPEAELVLLRRPDDPLGGKLRTEHVDGFVVEAAADSFLSRKERGVGLCEELGLAGELVPRKPENRGSFVRRGGELLPLPEGLTGMIPTNLDALDSTGLLSSEGRARFAAEIGVPPAEGDEDESIATFVIRRFGREAFEVLVEPLTAGIYGGDAESLSLRSTFPELRALERRHGSVLRGLAARPPTAERPPFLSLRDGMQTLADRLVERLERTRIEASEAQPLRAQDDGYALGGVEAEGVVLATPAPAAAGLLATLDPELAEQVAGIPYASSALVSLGFRREGVSHPLDGYGYVVPATEETHVLACSWSSSKWDDRAPEGHVLVRVFLRRIPSGDDADLVDLARAELAAVLGAEEEPVLARVHRWPLGMPQYVLGHAKRLERIDAALARHPGLALAGAAYRGVGIPDCIASGEAAAEAVVRALAPAAA